MRRERREKRWRKGGGVETDGLRRRQDKAGREVTVKRWTAVMRE